MTGTYTTHRIHTILHPGPKSCIFHIFSSESIYDVISHIFMVVQSQIVYINSNKENNISQWLAGMDVYVQQYFTTQK